MAAREHFSMTFRPGRRLIAAVLAMVSALATGQFVRAEESTPMLRWATIDGHVFQAKFRRLQGSSIVVVRDGFEFTVPISALAPASLELARHLAVRVPVAIRATPVAPVASFAFGPSILAFCQDNLGKKIGSGQCAVLAVEALKSSGAVARVGADWPADGDYVWGDLVASIKAGFYGARGIKELAHVEAGDIVQFHNARFVGFNHSDEGVYRMEARHHTAVVESVDIARKTITVLHQNWNHQEIVRRQMLYLGGMTSGWLRFYHPIPGPI
jgi:hypothetical protein